MIVSARYRAGIIAVVVCTSLARAAGGDAELQTARAQSCNPSALSSMKLDNARIASVQPVVAGGFTAPAARGSFPDLPAFCRIQAVATPSNDSVINFEVWVPSLERWNGKLVTTGNGGYSNALSYRDMAYALQQGYAAVGGDTGHQTSTSDDLLWGVGHPQRIVDWGTRSIHAITEASKRMVAVFQGKPARRAYYYGCSTGGHQGYAEIQRYPDDFDGVIAGAPGNNRVRLNVGFLWQFLANHRPNDNGTPIIPASKLSAISKAVVAACDVNDGVTDGVIDDPRSCRFDPAALLCPASDGVDCLTKIQVDALNRMYAGARNPRTGAQIYPGWPKGSEALTVGASGAVTSGWPGYWGTTEPTRVNFWRYWAFDNPQWNWWTFDFDRDLAAADVKIGAMVDQVNPDISAFKRRGGKAIVYQGWQDPVVNAIDTIAYYEKVLAQQGSRAETDAFFRLFLVPGMGHCSGGPGTGNFGNPNAASPVVDAEHDLLASIDNWVEKSVAPAQIIASRVVNGVTVRTRPLCPYPTRATYSGSGSTDEARNFVCR